MCSCLSTSIFHFPFLHNKSLTQHTFLQVTVLNYIVNSSVVSTFSFLKQVKTSVFKVENRSITHCNACQIIHTSLSVRLWHSVMLNSSYLYFGVSPITCVAGRRKIVNTFLKMLYFTVSPIKQKQDIQGFVRTRLSLFILDSQLVPIVLLRRKNRNALCGSGTPRGVLQDKTKIINHTIPSFSLRISSRIYLV